MDETVVYRPGTARPIAVATWATVGFMGAGQLLAGPYDALSTYAVLAGLAVVAGVAWVALWRPRVEVAPHGVELLDPLRTVLVTWPALVEVDGRFGLRLVVGDRRWSAWAAARPTSRERRAGAESEVASMVRHAWLEVRTQGRLSSGAVEGDGVRVHRHRRTIVALVAGLSVTVVLAVIA